MAFSEYLANRVRLRLSKAGNIEEKKMMGGLIFMLNGKMCVGVDKVKATGEDRLMVRVGKASHEQLLFKHGSIEMDFTGRVMRGFLFIEPEGFDSDVDMDFWVNKAIEFNRIAVAKK